MTKQSRELGAASTLSYSMMRGCTGLLTTDRGDSQRGMRTGWMMTDWDACHCRFAGVWIAIGAHRFLTAVSFMLIDVC
jgi:hypothetical protein